MAFDKSSLAAMRYRARTDLYWLATEILGYDRMVMRVHLPVTKFCVQKKPGLSIAEQEPEGRRDRLLRDPRGHFKTSVIRADIVQWLINFPDIRIFLGSGKLKQASDSLVAVKEFFKTNAKLRALFPEFCPPLGEEWGTTEEFTLPNRVKVYPEPSLMAFSLDSIKAGPHCDVLYLDDPVHQDNIGTPEQLQKTIERYIYLGPIPDPQGYKFIIGTPYSDADLYSWLDENDPDMLKFERRPAWTITNPAWKPGTPLTENDVTILFPEQFSFKWLNKLRQGAGAEYIFNCQYLLDPTPRDQATFTDELLDSHTLPFYQIPKAGTRVQFWDTASTTAKHSDYSVCATGMYDAAGNLFIVDVDFGKWGPGDLVNRIAYNAMKWQPLRIGIEKANGSEMMSPALNVLQYQVKRRFPIEWIPTSPIKSKGARIAALQPLLIQNKLYFSASIPKETMVELKKQFTKFPKYVHDDIPDAIAGLLTYQTAVGAPTEQDDSPSSFESVSYDDSNSLLGAGLTG